MAMKCFTIYFSTMTSKMILYQPFSHFKINSISKMIFCFILQTILVGDSGVGKTSLLVQFDQGKFSSGSFSATVGIGFTVSTNFL